MTNEQFLKIYKALLSKMRELELDEIRNSKKPDYKKLWDTNIRMFELLIKETEKLI